MVLSDPANRGLETVRGLMDMITRTKEKNTLPLRKNKLYHYKKDVIPHPAISAIFDHLEYFTTLNNNNNKNNRPVRFSENNYCRKLFRKNGHLL